MADTKITALTALTAADPANDVIPIVDVSDTSMAASGTTKKISVNNILGASGTATLASATITGAATVGTTLGVTGDLTASSDVLVNGNEKYVYLSSTYSIGSNSRARFRAVGAGGGSGYGGDFRISTRKPDNNWNTDALTVDSSANVNVAAGNVVIGTSGKGIDFSAVTGGTGSPTANVLNDYEEGAFTPTIAGNTIAGVGVYGDQNGRYTKVGRLVTCQIFVNWTAHTGTGDMRIEGLPFATASISGIYHPATIGWANNIALTAGYVITGYAGHNASTLIALQQYPAGGGAMTAVPIDTLGGFIVSISYIT